MAISQTPDELKNCKLKIPSLLFGPVAQYLGSDGFWALESQTELSGPVLKNLGF